MPFQIRALLIIALLCISGKAGASESDGTEFGNEVLRNHVMYLYDLDRSDVLEKPEALASSRDIVIRQLIAKGIEHEETAVEVRVMWLYLLHYQRVPTTLLQRAEFLWLKVSIDRDDLVIKASKDKVLRAIELISELKRI